MKDYGYESRQNLIASTFDLNTKAGRKRAFQFWVARGHSEEAASRASGYHHLEEYDSFFGRFVLFMVVGMVTVLLFILANTVQAANDLDSASKSAKLNETAFTKCLNGGVVRMGDRWFKCDCVTMADGTKCPEVWK